MKMSWISSRYLRQNTFKCSTANLSHCTLNFYLILLFAETQWIKRQTYRYRNKHIFEKSCIFAHHIDKNIFQLTIIMKWCVCFCCFYRLFSHKTGWIEWVEYFMPIDVCEFTFDLYWWCDVLLFGSMNHVSDDQIVTFIAAI